MKLIECSLSTKKISVQIDYTSVTFLYKQRYVREFVAVLMKVLFLISGVQQQIIHYE